MGVRQIAFGPAQGYSKEGLDPGYHWSIPFYSRIYLVPRTVQVLHMHREGKEGDSDFGPLEIQTADRSTVDVDISVLIKFLDKPGEQEGQAHGGPANLLNNIGADWDAWARYIHRTADDQLKRTLGVLSTADFYDPMLREREVQAAQLAMNKMVAPYGIGVEVILLRRYSYRADRIDNAIFQKNLQDQEERLNVAASKFAQAQADLAQVEAEGDARILTLKVEGDNKVRVVRSEGDLYEKQKIAEADLLVAKAKAEVDKLRASALARSVGADVYVAREMSPLLGSLKGGVVSNVDPYDLESWMKRLGVTERGQMISKQ